MMPFIKKSLHYLGYCYIWIHKSYSIALQGEFCQSASCAASWNMPTNFWGELSFSTATIRKPLNTVELSVPAIDTATKEIRSVQRVLTGNSSSGMLIWRHLLVGLSRVIHHCWPQKSSAIDICKGSELGRAFFRRVHASIRSSSIFTHCTPSGWSDGPLCWSKHIPVCHITVYKGT